MRDKNPANLFQKYLDWNENQILKRIRNGDFCDKSEFIVPVLDLPILKNDAEYRHFFVQARDAGFQKFNLGLTPIWNEKLPRNFFQTAKKIGIDFASAHGTSLKYSLKYGIPYQKILLNDKRSLDIFGKKKMMINYDLFAGHLPNLRFTKNFKRTTIKNCAGISEKIGDYEGADSAENYILKHIIEALSIVFSTKNEQCYLTLEIPGTKGWSMIPNPHLLQSDYILNILANFLPEAGITIDIAHLLTWGKDRDSIARAEAIIEKYAQKIRMLHLCSAGTDNSPFRKLYKKIYKNRYPKWHISGLDASLFIFEPTMIHLISYARKRIKRPTLEVSESRLPSLTVEDYFPNNKIKTDNEWFYELLMSHAKILQYVQ